MAGEKYTDVMYGGRVMLTFTPGNHQYKAAVDGAKPYNVPSATTITGVKDKSRFLIPWASRVNTEATVATIINPTRDLLRSKAPATKVVKALREFYDEVGMGKLLQAAQNAHDTIKEDAGDVGTIAHEWLQKYIKTGEQPDRPLNPLANNAINAGLDWIAKHKVEFIGVERRVFSLELGVAGTTDFYGKVDGALAILDWKSGSGIYDEMFMQIALYQTAIEEEDQAQIDARWIINIDKKTGEMKDELRDNNTLKEDMDGFRGLLAAYNWQKAKQKNWRVAQAAAGN